MVIRTVLGVALGMFSVAGFAAAWRFGRRDDLRWFVVGMLGGFAALLLAVYVLSSPDPAPGAVPSAFPAPPVSSGSPV